MHRFLTGTGEMDPVPWVTPYGRDTSGQNQACPEPYQCYVQLNRSTQTSDGRVFAPDGTSGARPLQIFPTVSPVATGAIATVHHLQAVGEHLLLAGTNTSGHTSSTPTTPPAGRESSWGPATKSRSTTSTRWTPTRCGSTD